MSRRTLARITPIVSLLPLVVALSACSSEGGRPGAGDGATLRRVSQPIVNGTPSTAADNAVVYIADSSGGFCTGTFIAPNLVITARHCVSDMNESSECGSFTKLFPPSRLSIQTGVKQGARVATVTKFFVDAAQTSGCSNDIALMQLDRDVPGALIAKVRLTKLTLGETARTVGYGDNGSGSVTNGRYQKTGIKIDSVGPASYTYKTKNGQSMPVDVPVGEVVTGESTCFGDSGGPLFDGAGNVIGVTSRGIDDSCIDRPSIYSDTASHAKLILDAATAAGHPLAIAQDPPTTGGTTEPDPDDDSDPAPKKNPTDDEDEDEDEEETTTPAKKKKPSSSVGAQPASCSLSQAAQGTSGAPRPFALAGLVLAGALVARRRRLRDPRA